MSHDDSPPLLHRFPPLWPAIVERREKRFILHVRWVPGDAPPDVDPDEPARAHLGDPGRLVGVVEPGARVWLSGPYPPPRKLRWTVHAATLPDGTWVGLDAALANRLALRLHERGLWPGVERGVALTREHTVTPHTPGARRQRVDLAWPTADGSTAYCEIKTVGGVAAPGLGAWPDAPSERGRRHVELLHEHVLAGGCASVVFVAMRDDVRRVTSWRSVDPATADALCAAAAAGVTLHALVLGLARAGVRYVRTAPVTLDDSP